MTDTRDHKIHWTTWVIPLAISVLGLVGSYFTAKLTADAQKEGTIYQSNVELVKLATSVIQDPGGSPGLKEWAIAMLSTYTNVPITPEQRSKILGEIYHEKKSVEQVIEENPDFRDLVNAAKEKGIWWIDIYPFNQFAPDNQKMEQLFPDGSQPAEKPKGSNTGSDIAPMDNPPAVEPQ